MEVLCRGMLGSRDVTHFQYDVAEVKLSVRERPEWLTSLENSGQQPAVSCLELLTILDDVLCASDNCVPLRERKKSYTVRHHNGSL